MALNHRKNEIESELEDAYGAANAYWGPAIAAGTDDMAFWLSHQWDKRDMAMLRKQNRQAYVKNKIARIVNMISGYQIANRLALKVSAVEKDDEENASVLSQLVQITMSGNNIYETMSDAFRNGAIVSGINLIEPYITYEKDLLSGDIMVNRLEHNQFLLDPMTRKKDLSDCGFILRRNFMTTETAKKIMPEAHAKEIERIARLGHAPVGKYPHQDTPDVREKRDHLTYDEHWVKTSEKYSVLLVVDPATGQIQPVPAGKRAKAVKERLASAGLVIIREISGHQDKIEKRVFVNEHHLLTDVNPYGLRRFPHVPIWGLFVPEIAGQYPESIVQGQVRFLKDPQAETNKRTSQMTDILESQANSGIVYEASALVDPSDAYKSGQGLSIGVKDGKLNAIRDIQPGQIPQSMFQLVQQMDADIMEIAGVSSELMGQENKDIPVALAKLRQATSAVMLQPMFDNYRLSKKLLGLNLSAMIAANYSPQKIQRIVGKPLRGKLNASKYNIVPQEGILTDTQKGMHFSQLLQLKQMGVPIPFAHIVDYAPIEKKEELRQSIAAQEKQAAEQQSKQAQRTEQLEMLQVAMLQAELAKDRTQAAERATQARWNEIRAAKDVQEMGENSTRANIELIDRLLARRQQPAQTPQPAPVAQ